MTCKELNQNIESIFGINDISKKNREREAVYLRCIYYHIGKNVYSLSINSLAKELNQRHASGLSLLKKHINEISSQSIYRFLFSEAKKKLCEIEEVIEKEKLISDNEIIIEISKGLLSLDDWQLIEFRETRLKPFLLMKKQTKK